MLESEFIFQHPKLLFTELKTIEMPTDAQLIFTDSGGNAQTSMKVLQCDFGIHQKFDHRTGRVTSHPMIDTVNVVVESSQDTQLSDWALSPAESKNVKIEFTIQNNVKKTIEYRDAFCIHYHESFNHLGSESPMQISISFSSSNIKIDDYREYSMVNIE